MTALQDVRAALAGKADAAYLKSIQRLVPGIRSVGVRVPQLKALAAGFHKSLDDAQLWTLMDSLCASRVRDEILLGVFVIARRKKAIAPWSHVEQWVKAIDNWETCDQLATVVLAPLIASQPALEKQLMGWAKSDNCWMRRLAVATTVGLNQRGRSNPALTLKVCEPLLDDPEAMVRKAVGWALREASEQDPKLAFEFLRKHAGRAHKTVLREGSQKLDEKSRRALLG